MKTRQEIQKWILENCVDSDGDVMLNELDFGDKAVYLNRMKSDIIYQWGHKAKEIFQSKHEAKEIFQHEHQCNNVKEGEHIKKLTLEEEVKMLREENERLKTTKRQGIKYIDKYKKEIKDGDILLFSHEDSVQPSGFSKYITNVELCFWSDIEERYIPFSEIYDEELLEEAEIVINSINKKFLKPYQKIRNRCKA